MPPDIEAPCPFCAGRFFVWKKPESVGHSKPPCDKFLVNGPTEFLRLVNDYNAPRLQ